MSVRRLGPEDAAAAVALVRSFQGRTVSERYVEGRLSDPANLLLVAERAGVTLGFVWAHWLDRLGREGQHVFLYEIEVDGRHRRKGVGRHLMEAVLFEARTREADVFVFTNRSNTAAVAFYQSLGGRPKNGDDLLFVYPYADVT